ncbi:hypothetical protein NDU88_005586 [Pleurodeles waltl]|uniref:Uncharacterized protein n=1 Tax=Pleurodeles waltl TaxID=8319 RepID=A0AAV7TUE0_PLEWA|nr:hypothetical protein NDU88_005586 [Pleurodeles waltl]
MWVSELLGTRGHREVTWDDIAFGRGHLVVRIGSSKTDQQGFGARVVLAQFAATYREVPGSAGVPTAIPSAPVHAWPAPSARSPVCQTPDVSQLTTYTHNALLTPKTDGKVAQVVQLSREAGRLDLLGSDGVVEVPRRDIMGCTQVMGGARRPGRHRDVSQVARQQVPECPPTLALSKVRMHGRYAGKMVSVAVEAKEPSGCGEACLRKGVYVLDAAVGTD